MCEAGRKADRPPGGAVYFWGSLGAWLSQEGDEMKVNCLAQERLQRGQVGLSTESRD